MLYKNGAKGGTVYVNGSRTAQVLSLEKEAKEEPSQDLINMKEKLRGDRQDREIGNEVDNICPLCNEGVGYGNNDPNLLYEIALDNLKRAQSRGGDQAIIRNYGEVDRIIFGGKNTLKEKNIRNEIKFFALKNAFPNNFKTIHAFGEFQIDLNLGKAFATLENHLDTLKEASLIKKIGKETEQINSLINQNKSVEEILYHIEKNIINYSSEQSQRENEKMIGEIAQEVYKKIEKMSLTDETMNGISSGLKSLDKVTNGFQKGDLVILAARPSMGKTSLALKFLFEATNKLRPDEYCVFFSLEMNNEQIVQRIMSMASNVPSEKIRNYKSLSDTDKLNLQTIADKFSRLRMIINDSPNIHINDIQSSLRKISISKKISLVVIDYLQLISSTNNSLSTQEKMSEISRKVKQIARQFDVPVIALSQLSRTPEKREDKRPIMSDLRDSGAIEQDADIVMFLYRDDYYNKKGDANMMSPTELIIKKHRNGPTGTEDIFRAFSFFNPLELKVVIIGQDPYPSEHADGLAFRTESIKCKKYLSNSKFLILESPHPSPLSCYRGFFGNNHFQITNNYLKLKNTNEIR
uniref:Uncharacterized protein n=1 Tax=Biomphalaria glabrata TaxID=6526 RepID=A0A2C9JR50_BIOGL